MVVSNVAGVATSSNALLTVTQPTPPQIDSITLLPGGEIQLHISGAPGHYAIEASTNLVDWTELTNLITTEAAFDYVDVETNLTQRIYRAHLLP